eukprot:28246-Eustigmatos_ZCMA.PRE.1
MSHRPSGTRKTRSQETTAVECRIFWTMKTNARSKCDPQSKSCYMKPSWQNSNYEASWACR